MARETQEACDDTVARPKIDRCSVPGAWGLVPFPPRDGRTARYSARILSWQSHYRVVHRLLRSSGHSVRFVRRVQPLHEGNVPRLRNRAAAILLVQLLVRIRGANLQRVDGTRFSVEHSDAGSLRCRLCQSLRRIARLLSGRFPPIPVITAFDPLRSLTSRLSICLNCVNVAPH
jgi:hypothetical protein